MAPLDRHAVPAEAHGKRRDGLRWAFAGTIVLTLVAALTALIELEQAPREVQALARTADRSSLLWRQRVETSPVCEYGAGTVS